MLIFTHASIRIYFLVQIISFTVIFGNVFTFSVFGTIPLAIRYRIPFRVSLPLYLTPAEKADQYLSKKVSG